MNKVLVPALIASALALSPTLASAQVSAVGAPGGGVPGDLSQAFQDGANLYSTMDVFIETAGMTLSSPGLSNFTDGSWVDTDVSNTWSQANGNPTAGLQFNVNFTDPVNTVTFDFWAFDSSGNYVDSASATYANGGWAVGNAVQSYSQDVAADAPEPASIFLIGSGMVALGFLRRRRRAQQ